MGCCCPQGKKNDAIGKGHEKSFHGGNTPVARSKSIMDLFMTHKERALIHDRSAVTMHLKLLLDPPFATFSAFSQHIYLTGIGGITLDNLKQYNIKCIVNVAEEIPAIVVPSEQQSTLICHKFGFVDNYAFRIGDHFHQVTNLMNKALKEKDGNVVVYCTAGMCRSSTIVLAYAIKYMKKSLKDAFNSLQEARNYARPSLAFFEQLVQFERECSGVNSVEMVQEPLEEEEKHKSDSREEVPGKKRRALGPTITVPNFYKKDHPLLFKLELAEARSGNCPMASNSTAAICKVSSSMARNKNSHVNKSSKRSSTKAVSKSKTPADQETVAYQSNELKPFVVETISYEEIIAELDKARKKKHSMQHVRSLGKTMKTKF